MNKKHKHFDGYIKYAHLLLCWLNKVKTTRKVKETLINENLEKLRDTCSNVRDLETRTDNNDALFVSLIKLK